LRREVPESICPNKLGPGDEGAEEFIPLEGTNADEETKSPAADVEQVDEGVPSLDEQDEQLDATEIISGDIEKEDT
jgi:hypothetical protein